MYTIFSALLPHASDEMRNAVIPTLSRFGGGALNFAASNGVTIRILKRGEQYAHASAALERLSINVDAWPAPPAGLFVVQERCVYLRSQSPMTVAHEFGHGLDCALGGGIYRSGIDPEIRAAFASAKSFVTVYAATGLDEFFAESVRAYVECNDPVSLWPVVSKARLRKIDTAMYSIVEQIFAQFGDG